MQRKIFVVAAALTAALLVFGFVLGMTFDSMRVAELENKLTETDILWNDARIQNIYYQLPLDSGKLCGSLLEGNLEFNNKIYEDGKKIEKYEQVNRFSSSLILEKKKYALLQMQFWINSIALRKMCNTSYSTIVYFYSFNDESATVRQRLESEALSELKQKCGNGIMLIPLPIDIGLSSVNIIKSQYNITETPSILVNETTLLSGLKTLNDLEATVKC
ncbi:hypothetical protein D4Q76_00400 [archaeon]|nr:MAG: hypothetical protein D4Q76_00400 [archaeon]